MRFAVAFLLIAASMAGQTKTRNILFVMTDGLRRQEVFQGSDPVLMKDKPAVSREALLPFLWGTMARQGQVYGNRAIGSDAYVTNGLNFSYPGYNETLTGFADARINSNDKVPNPNVTVLEWLNGKPAYRGKVAAFGAWDTFPAILNAQRAGFPVVAGYDPLTVPPVTPTISFLNRLKVETYAWESEAFDSFTFHTALEYLKQHQPRVLFLSLGETDEWSHEGKYPEYLRAARRVDDYLKVLWETVQALPQYRDKTTLVYLPDHGRGEAPVEWKSHGQKVPDSKYIWMAFLGPDTPALGERRDTAAVTQSQVAATVAALLGEDYAGAVPKAGKPIEAVLGRK